MGRVLLSASGQLRGPNSVELSCYASFFWHCGVWHGMSKAESPDKHRPLLAGGGWMSDYDVIPTWFPPDTAAWPPKAKATEHT